MKRLKLYERGSGSGAPVVVADPLAVVVRPEPLGGDSQYLAYWYRLGYRFALSPNVEKSRAGIPRYWQPCAELTAYLDGKEDRLAGKAENPEKCGSRCKSNDRTGLVVPSGILSTQKKRSKLLNLACGKIGGSS